MRALGEVTNPTGRLPAKEFDNRFRFHTAAQRWAAGMEAETPTLTGSDHALPCRCRDWGRDGLCGSQAKRLPSWPGPSASGWRPLLLHRARELRRPTWSSSPDTPSPHCVCLGGVMSRCGPLPSGRRPFFFPLLPLPVERRRKPLIACPSATGRRVIPSSFPRTTAANARRFPFPAGRHFFKEYPHAPR